ncbi:hypothetical protein V6000_001097 [Aspergillus fumigatus]
MSISFNDCGSGYDSGIFEQVFLSNISDISTFVHITSSESIPITINVHKTATPVPKYENQIKHTDPVTPLSGCRKLRHQYKRKSWVSSSVICVVVSPSSSSSGP